MINSKNRILYAFFLLVVGIVVLSVQVLESKYVASKVKEQIKVRLPQNITLDFDYLEFGYFPPRISFKEFKVTLLDDVLVEGGMDRLTLEYSPIDIIVGRPVISRLDVTSGEFSILQQKVKQKEEFSLQKLFVQYKKLISELPVYLKRLTLQDVEFNFQGEQVYLEKWQSILLPSSVFVTVEVGGDVSRLLTDKDLFDSLTLDAQISDNGMLIRNLKVQKELETFSLHGETKGLENFRSFTGALQFESGIEEVSKTLKGLLELKIPELSGYASGEVIISNGKIETVFIEAQEVVTEYARAKSLNAKLNVIDGKIEIEKMIAQLPLGGTAELIAPATIEIVEPDFLSNEIKLNFQRAHTNDLLFYVKKDLDVLKTQIDGQVELKFEKRSIEISNLSQIRGEYLRLLNKNGSNLLDLKSYLLQSFNFSINRNSGLLDLRGSGNLGNGSITFEGEIAKTNLNVSAKILGVNFEEAGSISNIPLKGKAFIDFGAIKTNESEKLTFDGEIKESEIYGYGLGDVRASMLLDLITNKLSINKISGNNLQTDFIGDAEFDLSDEGAFLIDIKSVKGSRVGLEKIYKPLLSDITVPEDLGFVYEASARIQKKAGEDVGVVSNVNFKNISYLNEVFEDGRVDVYFKDSMLKIDRFNVKKSRSLIIGNALINTKTGFFELDVGGSSIPLNSFSNYSLLNLGLKCNLSFETYASGTGKENNIRLQTRLDQCTSGGKELKDSILTVYKSKDGFVGTGRFLGEDVLSKFSINFMENNVPKGELSINADIRDLSNHFAVLSEHNARNTQLSGELKSEIKANFNGLDLKQSSLEINLSRFNIKNRDKNISIDGSQILRMNTGKFSDSKLEMNGSAGQVTASAVGDLMNSFMVKWDAKVDASYLELLSQDIESASGDIVLSGKLSQNNSVVDSSFNFEGQSFNLKHRSLPAPFTDIKLKAKLINNILLIDEILAGVGKGKLTGEGRVVGKIPFPIIDVNLNASQVGIPIHHKSTVFSNAEINVAGSRPPYQLKGIVDVYYASIEDELTDIPVLKSFEGDYRDLIPRSSGRRGVETFEMNLRVNVANSFRIRNSLMDISLGGGAIVKGGLSKPNYDLTMDMVPMRSRVLLKGHEFAIAKGRLTARDDGFEKRIVVDLDANSKVQNYELRLLASGEISRLKIDLTSNPSLTQEDIVSLLTLGVTSDVSRGLTDKERTSITTMGVGSLLFDQLKINQNLNSSMGLKLSLQPEFKKQDDNLFQSRSDTSSDAGAGYKSTTKLRVQKQIGPKMDMSLSSSLGSNTDQSQEMNINYQLNNDLSLEGIYEIKSDEQNQNINQESIGADIKYKWSF